jgi:hypothetical protein
MGERVQVWLLKEPPVALALHETVPVGAEGVPDALSVTVAVKVTVCPIFVCEELGVMVVSVVREPTAEAAWASEEETISNSITAKVAKRKLSIMSSGDRST